MAMTLFKDTTYTVSGLIDDIRQGDVALPDIQRPFVWDGAKVRDLLDSMYKGFPVGYLLFWETGAEAGARQIGTGAKEKETDQLDEAISRVHDLRDYPFKAVELASAVEEEQVAEVFVRINSAGVTLNQAVPLDRLREVIARWFFMAQTTGRYSGTFETQFERDTARLSDLKPGDADGYVRVLSQTVDDTLTADYWAITLPNDLATSASKSPALLAYIAALNILDADALLSTGKVRVRLDPAVTARKGIERHHLFPRAYLRSRLKVTDSREINQIANMTLVEWADNIAISDDAPAVYWPAQTGAKKLPAAMLERQLYWHALPPDWQHMAYPAFLAARRKLMARVVRDAYARLAEHGYSPAYPRLTPAKLATSQAGHAPGTRSPSPT